MYIRILKYMGKQIRCVAMNYKENSFNKEKNYLVSGLLNA